MLSPYQYASNTPIQAKDIDGLEGVRVVGWMDNGTVINTQTFHDHFTDDQRVLYTMHNIDNGTKTDLWVEPIQIRYEPSASEKIMAGVDQTKEYAANVSDYLQNSARSFDRMLKKKAEGMPTYEGEHGFHNGGKQRMLGTFGAVLSGGALFGASSAFGLTLSTAGLLASADDFTYNPDGTTLLGRATGNQKNVDRTKLGLSVVSLGLGSSRLLNTLPSSSASTEIFDISNTGFESFKVATEIQKELSVPVDNGEENR